MKRYLALLLATTLIPAVFSAGALAQSEGARGLDFRAYLSIRRGMTEGEVVAIAGTPDMASDQGFALSNLGWTEKGDLLWRPERAALSLKTYTYLPIPDAPYTTTITFIAGRVSEIQRDRKP